MSNICYSETSSSPSLRNAPHNPVTSPSGLCPTEVSCREAPCSPTSSLGSNTPDSYHEHCSEHTSCQSISCERGPSSPPGCTRIASGVSGPQEGTSGLPVTSRGCSFCRPGSCRQPFSCRLPSYQYYGCQRLGYLTCGRPPLTNLTYGYQAFSCMPNYYKPTSYTYSNFRPLFSSSTGWQYPY
uniref:Keratin-associated protein n=1 Tax=Nannospalax galili TaxID=1026970 RepID=A0A8C6RE87_NANGA